MKNILSRICIFTAIQGLNEFEKDLIPLIKDQGEHSYCWAYSITSAIELKYALMTGNRLKFNPYGIIDNVLEFYDKNKNDSYYSQFYDICKEFQSDERGAKELYIPGCALLYLKDDKKPMIYEYNNQSSNVILTNYSFITIKTLDDLIQNLKENKMIIAQYFADPMMYPINNSIIDYYIDDDSYPLDHNIIITGVGTLNNYPGIYVEIVNSWGLQIENSQIGNVKVGYDGLYYVKVADNEKAPLVNNLRLFTSNSIIDVGELENDLNSDSCSDSKTVSKTYKTVAIILGILTIVFLILFIIFLILFIHSKKNIDTNRQASGTQFEI